MSVYREWVSVDWRSIYEVRNVARARKQYRIGLKLFTRKNGDIGAGL